MLGSTVVALLGCVALAVGWVAVQRAWARSFPDAFDDPDVLAGRGACRGCGCTTVCQRRRGDEPQGGRLAGARAMSERDGPARMEECDE